jgi:UDP-2,3-diacylglucosamine pyrophosphatase LpxH
MSLTTESEYGGINLTATKHKGVFRFLSIGDIHLGHPRTPTSWIIKNLNQYLNNDHRLSQVDALFITGDVFDRLLNNGDPQVHEINRFITELLWRCARFDVIVRVVEGTPSHDREQSRFFTEQATNAKIPVDLHYATTLSIEHIERFNINVLYVPDKWRPHTQDTLIEVKQLMAKEGLDQLDFAIMHGAFEYQLPSIVPEPTHDSDTYLELVRYLILIGHVHEPTQKERILAAGSFDRDTHGQEHPKGFYDVSLRSENDWTVTFVENKDAKRYDTIDCVDLDSQQAASVISKHLATLPNGSSVKIRCRSDDPIAKDVEELKKRHPQFEWAKPDIKTSKQQTAKEMDELLHMDIEEFIPIDPKTLPGLLRDEITKHTTDPLQQQRCLALMEDILE